MQAGRIFAAGSLNELQSYPSLPLAVASDASVTLEGVSEAYDAGYGLMTLRVEGSRFVVPITPDRSGERRRVRIAAGEVSLARERSQTSTILNIVPVRIVSATRRGATRAPRGPTDLTKKGGDDRTLAVYFVFIDGFIAVENADLMDLLRQGRGYLLMYVWGGSATPGTILPSPYFDGRGRTIIKRAADAPMSVWFREKVDLRSDFRNAFGRMPGRLVAVAVSSDSDDTKGLNIAAVADLDVN